MFSSTCYNVPAYFECNANIQDHKMKKLAFYLSILIYSSNVLGTSLSDLDEDSKTNILEFLDADDLQSIRRTDRQFRDLLAPDTYLRNHMFDVTLNDGSSETLRDYFQGEITQILGVKNLETLMKESPNPFIHLMMLSIPHTPETIESDLRSFHQDTFQIEKLICSLPTYETPQQKLASVLLEQFTWCQVNFEVGLQVADHVRSKAGTQAVGQCVEQGAEQVGDYVRTQVGYQLVHQVRNQVGFLVLDQVWNHVLVQFLTQFIAQVNSQVGPLVNEDLRYFQFASAFQAGNLNEILIPAIDYTLTVYQLGTLAMRHSEAFKTIHRGLSQFISQKISEEQATAILNGLNIPDAPEGNYLVETQLKMIKRHLPNAE